MGLASNMAGTYITMGFRQLVRWLRTERSFSAQRRQIQTLPSIQNLMENLCPNASCPEGSTGARPVTILVEGNIGSGKTTFLKQFDHLRSVTIVPEPVNRWTAVGGQHNLLQLMYEQPKKYALALQTYVQLTMLQNHRQPVETQFKFMERSLYSARYCFVENLFRSELLSEVEMLILDEWFQHLITAEAEACKADIVVYLRTDPEVVLKRVQLRAREGEKTVGLDYLRSLHELHEQWFLNRSDFPLPCDRVLCVNANQPPELIRDEFYKKMNLFNPDDGCRLIDH